MKLAILAQSFLLDKTSPINGTLVQLFNLSHGFTKNNIEVHYICTTKDQEKPDFEIIDGIHFYWIQSQSGLLEWKRVMSNYKNMLNSIAPDALYVRGRNVLQCVAGNYAKAKNIPYVWGTNGDDSADFYRNVTRLKQANKPLIKKLFLFPLKAYEDYYINKGMRLSKLIVNQSIDQQVATRDNLGVNGCVLPSYFYLPVQDQVNKENLVLWFANLSKVKQPELFIDIVSKLKAETWNFILAGGSNVVTYAQSIAERAQHTTIQIAGKIEFKDSFQFYSRAKIYINTSKPGADGLPNAYIQSWLSGVIVLSLHHDPNDWMNIHNIGYCSHGDIEELVLRLQWLVDHPNELSKMSENAKIFATHQFSNDTIIEDYKKLFQNNARGK
jgi:glycosyltransferase involved in cell wall biosynthesis